MTLPFLASLFLDALRVLRQPRYIQEAICTRNIKVLWAGAPGMLQAIQFRVQTYTL